MQSRTFIGTVGLFAVLVISAIPDPAWAQVSAQQFSTWVTGPTMLGGLIGLAAAVAGIIMMFGRHTWEGILFVVIGAIIIGNATQIGGYFGGS